VAIMHRFADVLGAPLEEVSQAFVQYFADTDDITIGTADVPKPDEADLLDIYRALCTTDKARLLEVGAGLLRIATEFADSKE